MNAEQASHEVLGVKRIVSERQWQISSICLSGIQGSEPDCMTRLVSEHDQPHIRSPFATAAPTSRLRRAGLRKTRTILENGVSGHGLLRFVDLDPSGLILSWGLRDWLGGLSSCGLHHSTFDDEAGGHIFPECDEQLSRQRHDRRLAQAAAVAFYAIVEPKGERRVRLMAQP